MHPKIVSLDRLLEIRASLKREGKRLVQCHGCFDIVHPGHLRYLQFARGLGDALVVSVSGDDVVGKGWDRPYVHEELRAENLAALEVVDYVVVDHHEWAGPVLDALRPDVYVKGREYETSADPRFLEERKLVEANGGRVVFSSGDVVFSSTSILSRRRDEMGLELERVRFFCKRSGIDRSSIDATISRFGGVSALVIGDPILDVYVHAEHATVAAEGPILNVTALREERYVGGAGLVARQLAALGARVSFLTTSSHSEEVDELHSGLARGGVRLVHVGDEDRPIYVKRRYLVDGQKVLKVNHGTAQPPSTRARQELESALADELRDHDGLVVCDFGYGLFGPHFADEIAARASEAHRPYYADVSTNGQANVLKFRGPKIATPTETELRFALGDAESGLSNLAARYYRESGAGGLVLTMGKRGAILFHPPEGDRTRLATDYIPALETTPRDTVGAGDVFLAAIVMADLAGAPMSLGLYLASVLASLKVKRIGNDPIDLQALRDELDARPELAGAPKV
jgi:rfaE bifunctional protein kinase chain/domain/rfaE bifunctional protein nucleotidyltransferase chain/domain